MTLNSMKEPPNVKFELQGRAAEAGICDFLIGCESVLGGGERSVLLPSIKHLNSLGIN